MPYRGVFSPDLFLVVRDLQQAVEYLLVGVYGVRIYIYTYFFPSVFCGENITELLSSNEGSLRKIAGITPFHVGYVRLGVESTLLLHRSTTVKAN